jgi:hypothetical protein
VDREEFLAGFAGCSTAKLNPSSTFYQAILLNKMTIIRINQHVGLTRSHFLAASNEVEIECECDRGKGLTEYRDKVCSWTLGKYETYFN